MRSMTERALVIYPNNGDYFEANTKDWIANEMSVQNQDFARMALEWREHGGNVIIGGCCNTNKDTINCCSKVLRGGAKE